MQKKLIALAVAGMLAAPIVAAQTNVTVYGRAELGVANIDDAAGKGTTTMGHQMAQSRVGFRGTEDLGNGLSAFFQIEFRTNMDEGTLQGSNAAAANSAGYNHLGLRGDFGTVMLGRLGSPGDAVFGRYNILGSSIYSSNVGIRTSSIGAVLNNAIAYVTPNFNGLTATIAHALDEDRTVSEDITGLNVRYANGPIDVAYVYHLVRVDSAKNIQDHFVGGSYDFGAVRAVASWETRRGNRDNAAYRDKVWNVGAVIPVSEAGTAQLGYGHRSGGESERARVMTVGYTHSLSARTSVTAAWRNTNYKDSATRNNYGLNIAHTF